VAARSTDLVFLVIHVFQNFIVVINIRDVQQLFGKTVGRFYFKLREIRRKTLELPPRRITYASINVTVTVQPQDKLQFNTGITGKTFQNQTPHQLIAVVAPPQKIHLDTLLPVPGNSQYQTFALRFFVVKYRIERMVSKFNSDLCHALLLKH